ncbi:MAG: DUF1902 domain-containing protein [Candidatus Competibacter sp.]|nr:DUF1902 domain-containing protein [Candidatus Competibacter sp.]
MKNYEIHAEWDTEAGVWIATSEDVPGLCAQADTFDDLVDIVTGLVPDLLALNHIPALLAVPIHITAERTVTVQAA